MMVVKRSNEHHTPTAIRYNEKYRYVSCPDVIAHRKDKNFYDPNEGLQESPKRYTITSPPFWISLHKEWFDQMRWVSIMKKGNYYETGLTEVFKDILSNVSPGLVLDVGMNIGWFTLWSRSFGHSVASFEPNPVMHIRVCESLALNEWDKDNSVKIYPYGLANVEGVMNLTTGKNPGMSSFYEDRLAKRYRKSITVDVVKIDNVANQEGWLDMNASPIHLIKIDVEGYENFVLKGGAALIRSKKASNIIIENSLLDKVQVLEMMNNIYLSGYQVHALLSVNGDILQVKMEDLNKEISLISSRNILVTHNAFIYNESTSPHIHYLYTRTLNMWWVKRDD